MNPAAGMLEHDASPSFWIPLRYFVTAPLFGIAAGGFLVAVPDALLSRWMPGAFALTHLIAVGFMLMVMVGSLFQILPVVAGGRIPGGSLLAGLVHACLVAGTGSLAWGLAVVDPIALVAAAWLLGAGLAVFILAAAVGLWGVATALDSGRDLRLSLVAFGVAIMLGVTLAMVLAKGWALPLQVLLKLHVGWALLGGAGVLLAATSWIVVPMFQITPAYPARMTRYWAPTTFVALLAWSAAVYAEAVLVEWSIAPLLGALAGLFAVVTLVLQRRSRKSVADTTHRAFRAAMVCVLVGLAFTLVATKDDGDAWPLLAGALFLYGAFTGVIQGMLYKIVPFLAWMHLTQEGVRAPSMKKLQPDAAIRRQMLAHWLAVGAVAVAILSGDPAVARAAGVAVVVDFAWLLVNILGVLRRFELALNTPAKAAPKPVDLLDEHQGTGATGRPLASQGGRKHE